jgi:hypothetical protein
MARWLNGNVAVALIAGAAGGLLAPVLWPAVARAARPAAKRAMKAGLIAYERGRELAAEWSESASDMLAEVEAERKEQFRAAATPAETQPRGRGDGEPVLRMNGGNGGTHKQTSHA